MASSNDRSANKVIASNRRARHDYAIEDTIEAGIVLTGSEVKACREGQVKLADSYARVLRGQLWVDGMHIPPYQFAHGVGAHDPNRARKLLLHRNQIDKLDALVGQRHVSLVPLSLYFKDGRVKVELGIGTGRKRADKRQAIAERDTMRELQRELGRRAKGALR
ncbi:MAG: SsrA-binding protein SmpB [Acidimicrobiales bacterium]|nr:SsrA-binding protein SmpB [Acidimicrobiales bacterium]MCB9394713.1 SsrA-binding protein SmpB [Acidimicrobiaceae bacterium]